jgi:hypothetical protein
MIQKISDFIHLHERLLIAVGILFVMLSLGNKWINYEAVIAGQQKAQANAVLIQQQALVQQLSNDLKTSQQKSDTALAQATAQILSMENQISSLRATLTQQQQQVKTEPLSDVATQWQKQISTPGGIQNTDKGLLVTDEASRTTVQMLLEIPVLTTEVTDYQNELSSDTVAINAQKQTIDAANAVIAGLRTQLTDGDKACKKDIADAKAVSRKSKRNWFIAGYIAGVATRGIIKLATGF